VRPTIHNRKVKTICFGGLVLMHANRACVAKA
jgi:hypothetical protein